MPADVAPGTTYLPSVGLLYIFNLIVGTGALALPKAFQTAGWGLSIVVLAVSALISYVAATFVIEALSVANAVHAKTTRRSSTTDYDDVSVSEGGPSSFEIVQRFEVSQMASMFLGPKAVFFSHLFMNVYLFGDLAIYSTTVPKSAMNILCSGFNASLVTSQDPCWAHFPLFFTRMNVYRICVIGFIIACLPMVLAGITKTKYLQLATTLSRWSAFILMICLATSQLISDGPGGKPPAANVHGFGSLFGCAVYAFMCHHSIPGLVTPMSSKAGIFGKLSMIYMVVLMFYFTLSLTGAFTFEHVQDIYTLNFWHDDYTSAFYLVIDYFLALFPVFTLTTNYPIVAITLINNVKVVKDMFYPQGSGSTLSEEETLLSDDDEVAPRPRSSSLRSETRTPSDILIPLIVIGLPTLISLATDNVLLLAAATGSYPGVGVQFIIPCLLVLSARKIAKSQLNFPVPKKNASPFQSDAWPIFMFLWAIFSILMVTFNLIGVQF
ncbi:unnamed protein product [Auanema sp. JU1783]|nr:unnamed protein product [Auanema sp. JU1783]